MSSKLKIEELGSTLNMEYKWLKPQAYFFAFFCLFWDGFLVVWYSIAFATDGPLMMILFPLIHVAVGAGLTYYTICLFVNKSYIEVDNSRLSIRHAPLPWWRGTVDLHPRDLEQLYVKEKINKGENGTTKQYSVRAKLKDGSDKSIIGFIGMEAHEAQQVEKKIESFLRIPDYYVEGEYGLTAKRMSNEVKTRRPIAGMPGDQSLKNLQLGSFLDFESNSYKVSYVTQYDWKNGDTDRLFQLQSIGRDKDRLLHLGQQRGTLNVFVEAKINLMESRAFAFSPENAPDKLQYQEHDFVLVQQSSGQLYLNDANSGLPVEQWTYESGQRYHIRVVSYQGMLEYFIGERELEGSFYKILNP